MLSQLVTSGALAAVIGLLGVALKLVFDYWNDSRWDKSMLRMLEIRDKLEEGSSSPKRKMVIEGEIDRLILRKETKKPLIDKVCDILLLPTGAILILISVLFSLARSLFWDTLEIYHSIGWEFTEVEVALQLVGLVLVLLALPQCASEVLSRKTSSWNNSRKQARNEKEQASENVRAQEETQ